MVRAPLRVRAQSRPLHMTELEPVAESDDPADPTTTQPRRRRWVALAVLVVVVAVSIGVSVVMDTSLGTTILALLLGLVILRIGWFFLQQFATPPPPPPEEGAMRKVKLTYRCSICGAEVRMTSAATEDPEPPRHCLEDMDLVAPID